MYSAAITVAEEQKPQAVFSIKRLGFRHCADYKATQAGETWTISGRATGLDARQNEAAEVA